MATRKPKSEAKIDHVRICAIALKGIKVKADYNRIISANTPEIVQAAWEQLPQVEQYRIQHVCNREPEPNLNAIANELVNCTALLQLKALKVQHGEDVVRSAWKLIPVEERQRLKSICSGQQPITPMENHTIYKEETPQQPSDQVKRRTLFNIGADLGKLNELLDECGDDAEQQELINSWLEQLGEERDRKLDNYAALISEMLARAEVRKAEAKRMMELASSDENRAKLLKERLMWFFQTHNLKTVETPRYKLTLAKNGGKQPLILKDGLSPTELPQQFQKVSIDPDTTAIREALERGETLEWAQLGERGSSIRIK